MLKKLCLFKIIILTLRHNSKVKPRLSGTQNHQRFYLQHKMISIMARIERTYSQEKVSLSWGPNTNNGWNLGHSSKLSLHSFSLLGCSFR